MSRIVGAMMRQFGPVTSSIINSPTLVITDNGDGTGAVATISGATAGTTNTVLVSDWPLTTFVDSGSRVGNGDVALASSVGPHLAYVVSELDGVTAVSNMVHFRVSDANESVFFQCLEAVQDVIQALALDGISSANIKLYKRPWTQKIEKPGISINPAPERYVGGTNRRDDVAYGIMVAMARHSTQGLSAAQKADSESELTNGMGTVLQWREQISRAFRQKRLAAVAEVYDCRIESGHVFWSTAFVQHHDVSALIVRCVSRELNTVI